MHCAIPQTKCGNKIVGKSAGKRSAIAELAKILFKKASIDVLMGPKCRLSAARVQFYVINALKRHLVCILGETGAEDAAMVPLSETQLPVQL